MVGNLILWISHVKIHEIKLPRNYKFYIDNNGKF